MSPLTVLLVPGAFHQPAHYSLLVWHLAAAGIATRVLAKPSTGPAASVAGVGLRADAAAVRAALADLSAEALLEGPAARRDVVVVAHSYGGVPAAMALEGYGEGEYDGIVVRKIVYVAAWAPPVRGMTLKDAVGGVWPEWAEEKETTLEVKGSFRTALYHDIHPDVVETLCVPLLQGQSLASCDEEVPFVASEIPACIDKVYVACEDDQALPFAGQVAMAQAADMRVVPLKCGHSPFLREDHCKALVGIVQQAAVMGVDAGLHEKVQWSISRMASLYRNMDPVKLAYLRTSLVFAVSVLVTWTPSSVNRVWSLVHPAPT